VDGNSGIEPAELERMVAELAADGAYGETGVWRPAFSPAWSAAQQCVAGWGRDAGLHVHRDPAGNVWCELPGTQVDDGVVASGSHIDSQLPGGRFDGALGVIAAVAAIRTLALRHGRPRRTLAAVSLCEEESSRFAAGMWGSRAITGQATTQDAEEITDADGISLADALRQVGCDPEQTGLAARSDLRSFIELHIEQGPLLEQAESSLGVVTTITGIRHDRITLVGRADHAGARPIDDRRDALLGAAEIISRVGQTARTYGRPAVTTVGRLVTEPNLAAAVAERAELTIDTRHPDARLLAELTARHHQDVRQIAARNDLALSTTTTLDLAPTECAPELVFALREAAAARGAVPLMLHSGAAHDAQRMAAICDVAMLFVRSRDGRSHTPAEFTSSADALDGIGVLTETLRRLAY
jgi:allantoate deiminase